MDDLGIPNYPAFQIDPSQLIGAKSTDWVAFKLETGHVARRHDKMLTGPNGTGKVESTGAIAYQFNGLPDGISPAVHIGLPDFTVPVPAKNGLTVIYSGTVEATPNGTGFQTPTIDLYSSNALVDTLLASTHPAVTLPAGVWPGVLLAYQGFYTFAIDSSGNIYGSDGNSYQTHPEVYQYLRERHGVANAKSLPIGL